MLETACRVKSRPPLILAMPVSVSFGTATRVACLSDFPRGSNHIGRIPVVVKDIIAFSCSLPA
jgi:hypothetical protein